MSRALLPVQPNRFLKHLVPHNQAFAGRVPAPAPDAPKDAVSRELTVANGSGYGQNAGADSDAVSRELTVANGAGFVSGPDSYPDAVSRELTVSNGVGTSGGTSDYPDAVSRELTVANGPGFDANASSSPDAVSREVSVNNAPPVDVTPPDTSIVSGPPPITCDPAPVFVVTGTDDITAVPDLQYRYRVDGGVWQGPTKGTTITLTALGNGPHTFEVAAIDQAGNVDPTPAQASFVVDTLPPVLGTPVVTGVDAATVDVSWTSDKPTTTALSYRLLGATGWTAGPSDGALVSAHSVRLTGLTPGKTYECQANGTDACGSSGYSPIQAFTLPADTLAPQVVIDSATACGSNAEFTFHGSDDITPPAKLMYQYRMDGGVWQGPSAGTTASFSGLTDGKHVFEVEAIDEAGNVSDPAAYGFTSDARPLTIDSVQAVEITATGATLLWQTNKPATSQVDYRLTTDSAWNSTTLDSALVTAHRVLLTGLQTNLSYTFRVRSQDGCGTEVVSSSQTFTTSADTTPPVTSIVSGPSDNGLACDTTVQFCWTGTDNSTLTGDLQYSYRLDGAAFSDFTAETCHTFTGLAVGPHTFQVRAQDASGNVDPNPATVHFTVDTTPPVITAVTVIPRDYQVTVTWTTDKPATSQVEYGPTSAYGSSTALDPTLVTSHSVTVTGLTPLTAYHFRVKSGDGCHETDADDGTLTTTDILKPDLEVTSLTFPATVKAHDQISVSWVVQNSGPGDTTVPWNDAVYLSPTATLDPKTATLLGKYSAGFALAMGASYTQTQTISLPGLSVGSYYLIVVADCDNTVAEADETNNALAMPITFLKVQTLIVSPSQTPLSLTVGVPQAVTLNVSNLSDLPMTGITATITGATSNVQVQVLPPSSLASMASDTAQVSVTATDDSTLSDPVTVTLTNQQGDTAQAMLPLSVLPNKPNLTASPSPITQGMVRGQQTVVEVTLTNTGAVAATGLTVGIPAAPWLTLSSPAALGDLAPGVTAKIVLLLAPDITLPLGLYTGHIAVTGTNTSLSISFSLNNLSDAKGDLKVTSSDEFTYFADDHPPLVGATVTLTDPGTGATVLTGTTDDQGAFLQQGVTEGNYNIEVTSPDHDAYRSSVQINAGKETDVAAFLSRQLVTYQWTVVPLDLQDQYDVELQAIFQTNVPAPVVTISPNQVDLTKIQFDQNGQAVLYFTITNHGLIAANDVTLDLPVQPDYVLTAPTTSFGTLPALSTIVVPVTITNVALAPRSIQGMIAHLAGGGGCFGARVTFDYICGVPIVKSAGVYFAGPGCTGSPQPGSGLDGPGPPGGGSSVSEVSLCDDCAKKTLEVVLECLFGIITNPFECLPTIVNNLVLCTWHIKKDIDEMGQPSVSTAVGCVLGYLGDIRTCLKFPSPLGLAITVISCAISATTACPDQKVVTKGHATTRSTGDPVDPLLTQLQKEAARLNAVIAPLVAIYGNPKWLNGTATDATIFSNFFGAFTEAITASDGTGRKVSSTDRANLATMPLPTQIDPTDVNILVDRWNRSLDYYAAGIYTVAQVQAGQSTDFIDLIALADAAQSAKQAALDDQMDGYYGLLDGVYQTELLLKQEILGQAEQAGVCAKVKIQLDQTVAITRTAFNATLQLNNAAANVPLTNIKIALKITDQAGNDQTSLFVISPPTATGFNAVDGTGALTNGAIGTATWTILPTRAAAASGTTQYFVSGEIDYTQSGTAIAIPLFPTGITVVPDPYLQFHYFLQRQVYSDDPFTPQIEPAEPFSLGLLVVNAGMGTARNLTITSSQPKIVDNEKGLLIGFKLIGTQVNADPVSPSLMVNLGDIAPDGGTGVADFLLTASLAGQFLSEAASFKHVDGLGNAQTSLIDSVDTHSLEHVVRVDVPTDDGKPDFLADDIPDADNLPDTLWNSDGTTAPVTAITSATVDGAASTTNVQVHLSAPATAGWVYIRVDDPAQGLLKLTSVVRSDGRTIRLGDNAWTTSRLIHLQGQPIYQQNRLYLFDKDTTGSYTLNYAQKDPVNEPLGSLKTLPDGTRVTFGTADGGTGGGSGGTTGGGTGGLSGPVAVTAAFPDALYLEATDRSSGIKAVPESGVSAPQVGDLVTGAGTVRTDADGERYLDLSALSVVGSGPLTPLEITTKGFYGGDSIGYDPSTGAGQKGMAGGAGLDPVGLLAATLGRVTATDGGALTLDDGYGRPVKALLPPGVAAPAVGTFVAAAGPVSLEKHADGLYPVLRLRNAADLAVDLSGLQGGFLSPTDTLLVGDNLFSLPGLPMAPAPPSVLSGIDPGDGSALIGRLTRYDAPTQSEVFWDSAGVAGPFGDFLLGEGYRLTLHPGENGQIGFGGFRTDFADLWISLPVLGATRIGTPFPVPVDWSQVLVTDGAKTVPLRDAAQTEFPPWLNSKAQYFDAAAQANKTLGLPEDSPDSTALVPWRGYYVFGMKDQMALIVPAYAGLPTTLTLSPSTALAGGPGLTLTVTGTHFTSGSVVHWNGSARPTVWVSPTQLTAAIPASDLLAAGTASVTVVVPGPYGGESAPPLPFTITAPPAVLISLTVPSPVPGGTVLAGTVTLNEPAPSDTVVGLSSSDSSVVRLHRAVIVPAGSSSATFEIDTYRSHVTKTVTLRASLASVALTAPLTITGR